VVLNFFILNKLKNIKRLNFNFKNKFLELYPPFCFLLIFFFKKKKLLTHKNIKKSKEALVNKLFFFFV